MSIQYNTSTLLKEPVGATREYDVDSRVLVDEEEPRSERVVGHTILLRTKHGVLVTAHLLGAEIEQCSRCLRELDVPVQIDIEEEFFIGAAEGGPGAAPEDDPEAFRIGNDQMLDLDDAVRQYWATALPLQPLCRPDCRGLCPRCGQDLNQGPCSCPPEQDEPAYKRVLRQLVREEGS